MGTAVSSLLSEVTARLGNRQGITARTLVWLNYAYQELLLSPRFNFYELDFTQLFNTVNTIAEYTLSDVIAGDNLWYIVDVRDNTNNRIINQRFIKDYDRLVVTSGQPVRYYRFGDSLFLDPTPNAIYEISIRYKIRPQDLVSAGIALIEREWDEILVVMTVIKGLQAFKQWDEANAQKAYLEQLLVVRRDMPMLDLGDADFGLVVDMTGRSLMGGM